MTDKQHIRNLLEKYVDGQYTPEELDELLRLANQPEDLKQIETLIDQYFADSTLATDLTENVRLKKLLNRTDQVIRAAIPLDHKTRRFPYRWIATVAAILIVTTLVSIYFWQNSGVQTTTLTSIYGDDVLPGGNRATITLSDGTVVELDENRSGIVSSGTELIYTDGGQVVKTSTAIQYATLSTPRGGQYRLTLPDGSKVILNAESSVTYPTTFADKQRKVELKGEAFFDVKENKEQPFIVATEQQQVTVTGTTFNINAYGDNNRTITTLVTGSVNVQSNSSAATATLKPGQQATWSNGTIQTQDVDTHTATGWADGVFVFKYKTLAEILPQLERWYDIQVDIHPIPDEEFYAEINRNTPLSTVLESMEQTSNLRFEIKERRLTLKKK